MTNKRRSCTYSWSLCVFSARTWKEATVRNKQVWNDINGWYILMNKHLQCTLGNAGSLMYKGISGLEIAYIVTWLWLELDRERQGCKREEFLKNNYWSITLYFWRTRKVYQCTIMKVLPGWLRKDESFSLWAVEENNVTLIDRVTRHL